MADIVHLVRPQTAFDPETVILLATAFETAWDRLQQSGSECARPAYARAMREVVARRIIETARQGIREPKELAEQALRFLVRHPDHLQ
jgi:hypothetical protein